MERVKDVIITCNEYIDKLKKDGILKLINSIQGGNEEEALTLIPLIADGLQWIIEVVEKTKDIQIEKINTDKLLENLGEINTALENEDYILMSDIFEFEILEELNSIQRLLVKNIDYI
ncbi:hypothetical protein U732_1470 [Clostridium argentinense CDC 2741]|uniref:DUF8042 domain-containing protein n=1 Tax=Clostridium argentinense CDC 2741 TaxID=1418104 RepID=A0A0C1R9C3_9CLOT|nr:hypothetical protein [Clostridium argentinense]ARC85327.1 hypothetical protein RSJ17_12875 [Clostridium argentinense]KIE47036.1 hypothetical protein U732_1470 [Clostridium argentinense CDC 2741]NFF41506.1 hypothetical protein [Clostridium argentinense]NFP52542.1 hypothetical protein [Clostridium argentinense]NFP73534.1 hypothetical protein [Clostridium argentinense]